jgi:hypothetical protein
MSCSDTLYSDNLSTIPARLSNYVDSFTKALPKDLYLVENVEQLLIGNPTTPSCHRQIVVKPK